MPEGCNLECVPGHIAHYNPPMSLRPYLDTFPRLGANVYVDPAKGPVVTSCVQQEVVLL